MGEYLAITSAYRMSMGLRNGNIAIDVVYGMEPERFQA